MGDLQVSVSRTGIYTLVTVTGDADIVAAPRLESRLVPVSSGQRHVVLDLGGVTFLDSTTVGVLLGLYRSLHRGRGTLALVAPPGGVARRVLDLLGIPSRVPTYDRLGEALTTEGVEPGEGGPGRGDPAGEDR
ncbi:STAS domain-containing protein [Bailinhaonella thermotolerans]|uniref:Anti-sigma factor antagonist n=1 Tax=Bailinhaonella thermotolerans TaxID=1070861 RepID=A0A3A4A845_9ACTN|nr:STAS domain-containing protein [Bailinhaonella thermotolerans]RJL24795.1 anti-sigma factor antagonist [Bailinhaonella thermotolerans]